MTQDDSTLAGVLRSVERRAREAGVFGAISRADDCVRCEARSSAEPAFYSVRVEDGRLWVALQTPARYLSQSIEADLMFTGDHLSDLLHEEIVDLGYPAQAPAPAVEHFRTQPPEKLYTFRSQVPAETGETGGDAAELAAIVLLGYEAMFRRLGDMNARGEG